jgi:hypothetical protein
MQDPYKAHNTGFSDDYINPQSLWHVCAERSGARCGGVKVAFSRRRARWQESKKLRVQGSSDI